MSKNICEYTDIFHSSFMHYFNLYFSGVTVIHIDSNLSQRVGELDIFFSNYKISQRWWAHTCSPKNWGNKKKISFKARLCYSKDPVPK